VTMQSEPASPAPLRRLVGCEFDSHGHPATVGSVEYCEDDDMGSQVVLRLNGKEHVILKSWRDQWGVFIELGDICVAQEDQTRSFVDGLIKCLQAFREHNECGTKEASNANFTGPTTGPAPEQGDAGSGANPC